MEDDWDAETLAWLNTLTAEEREAVVWRMTQDRKHAHRAANA